MNLIYQKEAEKWTEALPIGNGKTGVMAFGSLSDERLAINDSSLWSGYPNNQDNPESLTYLNEVRQLVNDKKYHKADKLAQSKFKGGYSQSYMPLGDIFIKFTGINTENYQRRLDLDNAMLLVTTASTRCEMFANYPSGVVVYRVQSDNKFNVEITLKSKLKSQVNFDNTFNLMGNAPDNVVPNYVAMCSNPISYAENKGMAFCLAVKIESDGKVTSRGDVVSVMGATNLTLYFTTATGFNGYDVMPETDQNVVKLKAQQALEKVSFDVLKDEHLKDYHSIHDKNTFRLTSSDEDVDTLSLLKQVKENDIPPRLIELFYDYGKYLMIAGSRKGGQALNLQGIWNEDIRPQWSSNYTVNINTEMNYWPTTKCNLTECLAPFVDLVYELSLSGKNTARTNYGVNGFCCNHNTDIWRKTSPVIGNTCFMYAPLCGVWLVNELYSHYKNGEISELKDKMLSILKEATIFASEYLVKENDYYIVNPSTSPEASFRDKFAVSSISKGTAFDMALVKQLFINYLEMDNSSQLSIDVKNKLDNLYPLKNGRLGVQEFFDDKMIVDKGHRHFSPLYAVYPAKQINYYEGKDQLDMALKLFNSRVSHSKNHIGWSACWGICLASRLHQNKQTEEIIYSLFTRSVFDNLFDAHFPNIFQIDGNFGFVEGVNQMLLYDENGVIELLPNIINNMDNGKVSGYKINGADISFSWREGKVTNISSTKPIKVLDKNIDKNCLIETNVTLVGGIY